MNIKFRRMMGNQLTGQILLSSERWTQAYQITTGHWCCESINRCQPSWSKSVDSDYSSISVLLFSFACGCINTEIIIFEKTVVQDSHSFGP